MEVEKDGTYERPSPWTRQTIDKKTVGMSGVVVSKADKKKKNDRTEK